MKLEQIQLPRINGVSSPSLAQESLIIEDTALPMRGEIVVSWFRSVRSGVRSDQFEAPYDPDVDGQGRLAWAAQPVLDALGEDLAGTRAALVLTDDQIHILAQQAPDRTQRMRHDRLREAPPLDHC